MRQGPHRVRRIIRRALKREVRLGGTPGELTHRADPQGWAACARGTLERQSMARVSESAWRVTCPVCNGVLRVRFEAPQAGFYSACREYSAGMSFRMVGLVALAPAARSWRMSVTPPRVIE